MVGNNGRYRRQCVCNLETNERFPSTMNDELLSLFETHTLFFSFVSSSKSLITMTLSHFNSLQFNLLSFC
jgi:hypothetical protein